jgi:hypothetical protein
MADGHFPNLVSKDRDVNAQTNPIWVELTDGTNAANFTGTSVDVNVTNSVTVTASDLDIRDLTAGTGAGEDNVLIFANTVKDGSGTDYVPLVDNDGNLQVDVLDVVPGTAAANLGKAEDAVHGSGDTGVMALAVRQDVAAALAADGDYIPLTTTSDGSLRVDASVTINAEAVDDSAFTVGTDYVMAMGALADETAPDTVDEGDIGIPRMTLDRKLIIEIADATTDSQRLAINATGEAQVDVAAHALTNANALPISKDNSANAETNPIYVYMVNTVASGSEIHDYDTAAAVASDATSNHDYAVANTTLFLKSIIWSGSGNVKAEVIDDPAGAATTIAVGFLTGRNGDTQQIFFDPPYECTTTLRVQRTNRQGAATDVYSTIIGNDV